MTEAFNDMLQKHDESPIGERFLVYGFVSLIYRPIGSKDCNSNQRGVCVRNPIMTRLVVSGRQYLD